MTAITTSNSTSVNAETVLSLALRPGPASDRKSRRERFISLMNMNVAFRVKFVNTGTWLGFGSCISVAGTLASG